MYSDAVSIPSWSQMCDMCVCVWKIQLNLCQSSIGVMSISMRLPHTLVHVLSVLDLFEGFVCVETASLVLDVSGVECHHLERCFGLLTLVAFILP